MNAWSENIQQDMTCDEVKNNILIILQDMTWEKDMPQRRALIFSSRHCYKTKGLPYIRITTRNCILSATMFMIPAPII
jgi:hypothetical protein